MAKQNSFMHSAAAAVVVSALASSAQALTVEALVTGLDTPWAVAPVPGGGMLVTEKDGRLLHIKDGQVIDVAGVPRVADRGQGGLLDVTLPRDFATSREVWLTYSKPQSGGAGTALAVGRLSADGTRLVDVRDLFESARGSSGGRHFVHLTKM